MDNVKNTKFGSHLIFDAYGCDYYALNDRELCENILNDLVKLGKMKKLNEPFIVEANENETLGGKDPGGYSGFVIIQESHVSIHTFAKRGYVTIDVYSCREFDAQESIDYLIDKLKPENYDIIKFDRGLKYPSENIY